MRSSWSAAFSLAFAVPQLASAAIYSLTDSIVGTGFYDAFDFEAISDPTHGRVNYVSQAEAQNLTLTIATHRSFILRADNTTVLDPSGPGRNSVRIQSKNTYTTHVIIFDVQHMPEGCSTWPALWENGPDWPYGGEVDILEGVNDQVPNLTSLHTSPNCTMLNDTFPIQTGQVTALDCDAFANSNQGCGVHVSKAHSYGPDFNAHGGGWYAMERTPNSIKVWFFSRSEPLVPPDLAFGLPIIDTDIWGIPYANFRTNAGCDLDSKFEAANVIINLTLCGDWAGNVYASDGCPGACIDFVNENPSAFTDAYFEFNGVRIYE